MNAAIQTQKHTKTGDMQRKKRRHKNRYTTNDVTFVIVDVEVIWSRKDRN